MQNDYTAENRLIGIVDGISGLLRDDRRPSVQERISGILPTTTYRAFLTAVALSDDAVTAI